MNTTPHGTPSRTTSSNRRIPRSARLVGTAVAAFAVAAAGLPSAAQAAATSYSDANVVITGGTATAINQCINTSTGSQNTNQQNMCTQIATAGNVLVIDTINITIHLNGSGKRRQPVSLRNVIASITGNEAKQVKRCAADAASTKGNRHRRAQARACRQRGDRLTLNRVNVSVARSPQHAHHNQ